MTNEKTPEKIAELLPFHINGSLSTDEQALVEAALETDDELRREAEMLRHIRATWQSQSEMDTVTHGKAGLVRLLGDIEALNGSDIPVEKNYIPLPANQNAPIRHWKQAGALAASLAIGVFLGLGLQGTPEGNVAVPASGLASFAEAATLTVRFRDDVVLAEVSGVLNDAGLVMVDGPSAMGLYRLAAFDLGVLSAEQVEALRARGDIFVLVEGPE